MGTMGTWGKGKANSPQFPSKAPMTSRCQERKGWRKLGAQRQEGK